ncbi:mating factor a2.1 [Sporisorium reilianum f. sp. reilianum]|uniref:Mating factor a2.1 n=2 Tax=Sporisorium reilianum TaxID=72558 RepID=A0A2N8UN15_9BASI|nr:mating factor a3.2 [Sporisorium reilianum]SJX66149.1 mating factor a2.1 [Sporisorium reilianum f. sp. reilianum]AJT55766.1 mating factor a1.2 [Sporisorium reilianum]CAI59747.1 mating factor a1.2 [Sporisorium reilianum]CAI59762.1 mating factor a3.2 [Sporisorium reilianum]
MFSIFTQTIQTSASEPQQSPADEGRGGKNGAPLGYSSCTIA